jgi:hypothetical protein
MMGSTAPADDRVLPATRSLSWAIVPFLVVAFGVLWPVPTDTGRLFAWHVVPTMTPMVLGAAYLGGAYFFVRAARSSAWHTIKAGFVPVATFATLMGIATVVHWDRFAHARVAFWLWAGLYFTTPFLIAAVYQSNRGHDRPATKDDVHMPERVAKVVGVAGVLAFVTGLFLFLAPAAAISIWPWPLTPLTARVLGAVFALGVAGVGAFVDGRWTSARIPLQVAFIMLTLIMVAGVRAHAEFDGGNPLTWVFAIGFGVVTIGIPIGYMRMERRSHG